MNKNNRNHALDSLRGIMACVVVFIHRPNQPTYVLEWGAFAVATFFIHSGFILSYNRNNGNYIGFECKRFLRMWPPFAVAVVFSWMIRGFHDPSVILDVFRITVSYIKHPLFNYSCIQFNCMYSDAVTPSWTLWPEMVMSLLLPIGVFLWKKHPMLVIPLCLLVGPFYSTVILGIAVAQVIDKIKVKEWMTWVMLILGFSVMIVPPTNEFVKGFSVYLFLAIFSCLIIIAIMKNKTIQKIFEFPVFTFIGKISFGIYLLHAPLISLPGWQFIPILLIAATIFYYFVEVPSIKFGKYVSDKINCFFEDQSRLSFNVLSNHKGTTP